MIPFLTYPLALLALASLPALAAIYILRNRFRRRQVSSLMLWQFQVQSKEGGVKIHRLQLPLLFFLELLALILLVTAATGPYWKLPQAARPLIVVLDDSFSMRAVQHNTSAQTRARDFLESLFRRQTPPVTRFILAGAEPQLLGSPVKKWSEAAELLRQWHCWSPNASIDPALTLAAELGKQQANILIVTDHKPAEEEFANSRIEWHAFGVAQENLGVVTASRAAFGEQDRCLIEIANFAETANNARLLVRAGSNAPQASLLSFAPRERQRLVFNIPSSTPELRASLDADPLVEDNEIQLLPPIRKRVRVQISLSDTNLEQLLGRTLEATGLRAAISANPELVVHEVTNPALGSNAWSLRWLSPSDATAFTGPFIVDGAHPLAEGIALQGTIWAGAALTNADGEVPVILAGNTPLLSAREDASGRRFIHLNLNPALSTLHNTPDWPSLWWNLLNWRAGETPGLKESNARLGTEVVVKTAGEPVFVTAPDGSVNSFSRTGDELALSTPLPGVYTVAIGTSTNCFAVNPLAPDESDLTSATTGRWGAWSTDSERQLAEASVAWLFGLLALAILAAHLYLIALGRGGR